jgi:hypothetical protein
VSVPAPDEAVADLLRDARTWIVVGLGQNPDRAAFGVSRLLQAKGRRIVPVHPRGLPVHGEPGFTSVTAAVESLRAEGIEPDVVDCFVNSSRVGAVIDEAVSLGVPAVWLQLDIDDPDAVARARAAGTTVVVDRCPAIEWPRLGPRA